VKRVAVFAAASAISGQGNRIRQIGASWAFQGPLVNRHEAKAGRHHVNPSGNRSPPHQGPRRPSATFAGAKCGWTQSQRPRPGHGHERGGRIVRDSLITPVEVSEWVEDHGPDPLVPGGSLQGRLRSAQDPGAGPTPPRSPPPLSAVGLGHLHPALAETCRCPAEHLVARAEHYGLMDSASIRRRAAAGERQHIASV